MWYRFWRSLLAWEFFSIWIVLVDAPFLRLVGLCVWFVFFFFSLESDFPPEEVDVLVKLSDEPTATPPLFTWILQMYHLHPPLLTFLRKIYHFHTTLLTWLLKMYHFHTTLPPCLLKMYHFYTTLILCLLKMYHLYHLEKNDLKNMNQISVSLHPFLK